MIQRTETTAVESVGGHIADRGRLKIALLADEVALGSVHLARVGLISLAMALETIVLVSPGHFRPAPNLLFAALITLGTLVSLALAFLATLPVKRLLRLRIRQLLAASALVALPVLTGIGIWHGTLAIRTAVTTPYSNDGAVMDLYAAEQTLHGHDPYLKTNIAVALARVNAPATTTTPLMDGQFRGVRVYPSPGAIQQVFDNVLRYHTRPGLPIPPEFESKYNYPAGSFLMILPFVWAGLLDMRFLYALAVIAMGAYLWYRMPRSLRLLVPLIIVSNVPLIMLTGGGQPDPLYGLFLMIGYAEWSTPWVSPVAMGVAVCTKQLAWFFVPFYVVLVIREYGWREAMRRCGIMGAIFALTNVPFMLESPSGYLASVFAPMVDPMFPLGVGIIALFVANVLPMLPKIAFTVMELGSWLIGVLAFAGTRFVTPAGTVVLAALPLFFAWRSLVNYFYLIPLLTLAVVLADGRRSAESAET